MLHPLTFPRYLVLTDFGDLGLGNGAEPQTTFADACTEWTDQMAHGHTSWVVEARLNAPLLDVTDEAREAELRRCVAAHGDIPAWLIEVPDDEGDAPEQRGFDAARDARGERRAA